MSHKRDMIEALTNTVVGAAIAFSASMIYFWGMDIPVSTGANLGLTGVMTVISILRGFAIRRFYRRREEEGNYED